MRSMTAATGAEVDDHHGPVRPVGGRAQVDRWRVSLTSDRCGDVNAASPQYSQGGVSR
jgi:hypothetical protein